MKIRKLLLMSGVALGALWIGLQEISLTAYAEEYLYDSLNRVVKVVYEDGGIVEYVYDANGNITQTIVTPGDEAEADKGSATVNPDKEATDKETTDKETTDKETTDKEATDKETTDKETTDKETTDKEATDKETSDKEDPDNDDSDTEKGKSEDFGNTGSDIGDIDSGNRKESPIPIELESFLRKYDSLLLQIKAIIRIPGSNLKKISEWLDQFFMIMRL